MKRSIPPKSGRNKQSDTMTARQWNQWQVDNLAAVSTAGTEQIPLPPPFQDLYLKAAREKPFVLPLGVDLNVIQSGVRITWTGENLRCSYCGKIEPRCACGAEDYE